jgi:integrase
MANSSSAPNRRKVRSRSTTGLQAAKPFADFPLFVHKSGRWAKKITVDGKAKLHYFGKVADGWEAALQRYDAQKVDLAAGRTPADTKSDGVTLLTLCNEFIHQKVRKAGRGKMTWRSVNEYKASLEILLDTVGRQVLVEKLRPIDFDSYEDEVCKRFGAVSQKNHLLRVRSLFKFALKEQRIEKPVNFGERLELPSKRDILLARATKGEMVFEAREIRRLLKHRLRHRLADPVQLRAMMLLAINCGLGNDDCGRLLLSSLDLQGGWCNAHRNKTGVPRRAKLWPETLVALQMAIAKRPAPKDSADDGLVFITKYGGRWSKEQSLERKSTDNPISAQFGKLAKAAGVDGKGRGFYCLRHTFFTEASNSGDQVAASHVMGHADSSIAANYRHRIDDARLVAVSTAVRRWLFRRSTNALWKPLRS